jgi:hypothetical protein
VTGLPSPQIIQGVRNVFDFTLAVVQEFEEFAIAKQDKKKLTKQNIFTLVSLFEIKYRAEIFESISHLHVITEYCYFDVRVKCLEFF